MDGEGWNEVLMKGFELIVWPGFKECKNRNHAHKCGWWEGAGRRPGRPRLLQHKAPALPALPEPAAMPTSALQLCRAMGKGGSLPLLHPLMSPQDPETPSNCVVEAPGGLCVS